MKTEPSATSNPPPGDSSGSHLEGMAPPGSQLEQPAGIEDRPEPTPNLSSLRDDKPHEEPWTWQRVVRAIMAAVGSVLALIALRPGPTQGYLPPPRDPAAAVLVLDDDVDGGGHMDRAIQRIRAALPDSADYSGPSGDPGTDEKLQNDAGKRLDKGIADLEIVLAEIEMGGSFRRSQKNDAALPGLVHELRQYLERCVASESDDQLERLRDFVGAINDILQDYERYHEAQDQPRSQDSSQGS